MDKEVSFIMASYFLRIVEKQNKALLNILDKEISYCCKDNLFEIKILVKIKKNIKKIKQKKLLSIQNKIMNVENILKSNFAKGSTERVINQIFNLIS